MSQSPVSAHHADGASIIVLRVPPRLAATDAQRLAHKVIEDPRAAAAAQATSGVVPSVRLTA